MTKITFNVNPTHGLSPLLVNVSGTLTNDANTPIPNATIQLEYYLWDTWNVMGISAVTNGQGIYTIDVNLTPENGWIAGTSEPIRATFLGDASNASVSSSLINITIDSGTTPPPPVNETLPPDEAIGNIAIIPQFWSTNATLWFIGSPDVPTAQSIIYPYVKDGLPTIQLTRNPTYLQPAQSWGGIYELNGAKTPIKAGDHVRFIVYLKTDPPTTTEDITWDYWGADVGIDLWTSSINGRITEIRTATGGIPTYPTYPSLRATQVPFGTSTLTKVIIDFTVQPQYGADPWGGFPAGTLVTPTYIIPWICGQSQNPSLETAATYIFKTELYITPAAIMPTVKINIHTPINGIVSPVGVQIADKDTTLTISAFPNTGYAFSHWTKDGATIPNATSTLNLLCDADSTIDCFFREETNPPPPPSDKEDSLNMLIIAVAAALTGIVAALGVYLTSRKKS